MSYYNKPRGGGFRGTGGGFRGSRGGEWRGRGSRGTYNTRGGPHSSGTRYFNSSTFESRPRSSGPSDKFGGRSREFHTSPGGYNKEDDYSSRGDYKRSPEPPRKRNRQDSSPSYMGPRRSDERSYPPSGEYSTRSFSHKVGSGGGYLTEKGSYREVRESKPEYTTFRKSTGYYPHRGTGRGTVLRGRSNLRGSRYRGGSTRGFKSGTSILARRRMESLGVRKRYTTHYDSRKIGSFRSKRYRDDRERGDKSDDDEDLDDEEELDEEDVEMDEEVEGEEEAEDVEGDESDEDIEDEEAQDKEDEDGDDGEEGEGGDEEMKDGEQDDAVKEEDKDDESEGKKEESEESEAKKKKVLPKKKLAVKKKVLTKKTTAKAADSEGKSKSEKSEKESLEDKIKEESKDSDDKEASSTVRLKCPHCRYGCLTFREYSRHLASKKHLNAMKNLSSVLRTKLTTMRLDQRKKQKALDNEAKATNPNLKTFYCSTCKLNYKTLKSGHFASSAHKKIKEFFAPYCRLCKTSFKSAWAYECHISEILHLKRKLNRTSEKKKVEEDIDLDPSHFMVLDAVGSGDDEESEKSEAEESRGGETSKEEMSPQKEEKKKKKKEEINLGAEHCKLIEVYFCDLCRIFVPRRGANNEEALAYHCRSRQHLERYVRFRDDQSLRRRAVKLHKEMEKEKKEVAKKKVQAKKSVAPDKTDSIKKEDEKVWSDVDKDLSDLLHEDEGTSEPRQDEEAHNGDAAAHDDNEGEGEEREGDGEEDEDSLKDGERYDRFQMSEKLKKDGASEPSLINEDTAPATTASEEK